MQQVYVTIIAIYVLQELYSSDEERWTLLVSKAKSYLKGKGVTQPDTLFD